MPSASLLRRYAGVAALLALLVPLTLGVEGALVRQIEEDPEAAGRSAARVRAVAQEQTAALVGAMRAEAERVAADEQVRRGLAARPDSTARARPDAALLRAVGGRTLPARLAVEVYGADGALVAWNGFALDAGDPRGTARTLDRLQTRVATDGAGRRVLVLWLPIIEGGRRLGAVRVLRVVQAVVPVRNRYLQDYDVADAWQAQAEGPFAVAFTGSRRGFEGEATPLVGPDGTTLGWADVPVPTTRALAGRVRAQTRAIAAFWAVLLAGWLLTGLAALHQSALRAARDLGTRRAWAVASVTLGALALALVGVRFGLLALDVPARWAGSAREPSALFSPAYLATDVGFGLLRSAGDMALTAAFAAAVALVGLRFALVWAHHAAEAPPRPVGPLRPVLALAFEAVVVAGSVGAFAVVARAAVLDATLPYFDRATPLPDALTLLVFAALLGAAAVATAFATGAALLARVVGGRATAGSRTARIAAFSVAAVLVLVAAVGWVRAGLDGRALFLPVVFGFALVGGAVAAYLVNGKTRWAQLLTFRGVLGAVLVLAPLTYALMARAAGERRDARMADAALAFAGAQDDRVVFALEQVLEEARADDALRPALLDALAAADSVRAARAPAALRDSTRAALDSLASGLVTGSLLASLADYAVGLVVYGPAADTLGSFVDGPPAPGGDGALGLRGMLARYADGDDAGSLVVRAPAGRARGLYRYAAVGPLRTLPGEAPAAWVHVRAVPRPQRVVTETPFPRVLVPADPLGADADELGFAEYAGGRLARYRGESPWPFRLDSVLAEGLPPEGMWRQERFGGQPFRALYTPGPPPRPVPEGAVVDTSRSVIAVRAPDAAAFDHLFALMRVALGGLALGAVAFALGLPARRRAGLLPAPRTRFRDKVLNRFLLVGLASVAVTGAIGQQVVAEQNRQSVRDLLRGRLARVEAVLTEDAAPGEEMGALLARARPEAIGAALGVDLHLYRGPELVASSRPQLVRQRLVGRRLPAPVYTALFAEGQRYAFAEERIGEFAYTTGYAALADASGRPVGAVAVPTLPEQAAIEAEQARMVAYLFGALLVLFAVIFLVTQLLAAQLTRPFGRLRAGLVAVGAGETDVPIPVETRDEVGELVETFNSMQRQLAESRRRLALQERQLAWGEMARQVAHEIKNPLTPMKLSVQHLRRAYRAPGDDATPEETRFAGLLDRISTTLIEQIDALDRIAGEFSSFARLPTRRPERLDLNEVVGEAAALFEDETSLGDRARLDLAFASQPLFVVADREELRRVYINLFKNALQAIPERTDGQSLGRITARTRIEGGEAVSAVEDTGAGIPEEARARIFTPNFSTKTSGMGLGLAIAKKTVEELGGGIDFATETGAGTTFTIRLPLEAREE